MLLNRIPTPGLPEQIDIATSKMLDVVRPDGIVEDWHGDGNTIRTALMYVMWKSEGARLEPWNPEVQLGAQRDGSSVLFSVTADRAWTGRLHFDYPRHRDHLHLPINYPRLNEWPEWFTVEHDRRYHVAVNDGPPVARLGSELVQGIPLTLRGVKRCGSRSRRRRPAVRPLRGDTNWTPRSRAASTALRVPRAATPPAPVSGLDGNIAVLP